MWKRLGLPSPALLIGVVALVAALAGTAIGGVAVTSLNKSEKKQVKKIAKKQAGKQIKKKAPGLSVADSDKLDGIDAADLQTSSAYADAESTDFELTGEDQSALTVSIDTTGPGRVIAIATVEYDGDSAGADDRGSCGIRIDGTDGPSFLQDVPPDGIARHTTTVSFAREVAAGSHSVALRCRASSGIVELEESNLTAWAVGG